MCLVRVCVQRPFPTVRRMDQESEIEYSTESPHVDEMATLLSATAMTINAVKIAAVVTINEPLARLYPLPVIDSSAIAAYERIRDVVREAMALETPVPPTIDVGGSTWGIMTEPVGEAGALLVVARPGRAWSPQDRAAAAALALVLTTTSERARRTDVLLHRQRLDELVSQVAARLMGATSADQRETFEWVVQTLASHLDSDTAFIRRNDMARGLSILEAEWPPRPWGGPGPDPLGEVAFDSDPVFEVIRDQREPYFLGGDRTTDEYLERINSGSGVAGVAGMSVPLLVNGATWGIIGFLHFHPHVWTPYELHALRAVASMLVQLQARIDAEQQIHYNANHDELTGLSNRRALIADIDRRLAGTDPFAILVVDLDRFKVMNDLLGHVVGDQLLATVATRIRYAVRDGDLVARLGGDEFVVVLSNVADSLTAVAGAQRIMEVVREAVDIGPQYISHTASVGVALANDRPETSYLSSMELLGRADVAMYSAKASGRNQAVVYDDELHAQIVERSRIELALDAAVRNGDLCLHYQPEVDLRTGKVLAVEALVRWNHPDRGIVPASEFIAVAEESGIIGRIGRWVFAEACRQYREWVDNGSSPGVTVRINLSPADFRQLDLLPFIKNTLSYYRVPPHHVCIEITEHAVTGDIEAVATVLTQLREMGLEVAIDDFGTGFATMSELKSIPTDYLKLDMGFVRGILTSRYDRAIVESICRLADALDLLVIGEGVESAEVARELVTLGCGRAQGYLFSRPVPPSRVAEMLDAGALDVSSIGDL